MNKCKLKKLYNFMLVEEEIFRVGTEEEIKQISKEIGYPVCVQTLASYKTVEDWICCGGEIPEGEFLEVSDGYIYVDSDTSEMDFYGKKEVCLQMLEGILETYI